MSYIEFIKKEFERTSAAGVIDLLGSKSLKNVLVYAHDDPDGLTSALIFTRLLEKLDIRYKLLIPPTMELEEGRLKNDFETDDYCAVFLLDKATMGYYSGYSRYTDNFVVIDHHPVQGGMPEGIKVFNPQIGEKYMSCSTSFLVHMISTYFGKAEEYDDYLALVGLKGDWAVEPATDMVSEYVQDFYNERIIGSFDNLIEKIESRPTMFEVRQKEKTTLLNQITELYFALGGGGFGYFYNDRDEKLKGIDQRIFTYGIMKDNAENFNSGQWPDFRSFVESTNDPDTVDMIFGYFSEDWEKTIGKFSNATLLTSLGVTDLYLFIGYCIPLMPMAGSVYLNELKKMSGGKDILFIMVNRQADVGIHFSMRGTASHVHCGKICSNLAERLGAGNSHKDQITGGGHPFAAECRTRNSGVRLSQSLEVFSRLIVDMEEEDRGIRKEGLGLGLEYLEG